MPHREAEPLTNISSSQMPQQAHRCGGSILHAFRPPTTRHGSGVRGLRAQSNNNNDARHPTPPGQSAMLCALIIHNRSLSCMWFNTTHNDAQAQPLHKKHSGKCRPVHSCRTAGVGA